MAENETKEEKAMLETKALDEFAEFRSAVIPNRTRATAIGDTSYSQEATTPLPINVAIELAARKHAGIKEHAAAIRVRFGSTIWCSRNRLDRWKDRHPLLQP